MQFAHLCAEMVSDTDRVRKLTNCIVPLFIRLRGELLALKASCKVLALDISR
jgi:hypothetical protein